MSTYGNGQSLRHKSYLKTKRNKRNVSRRLRIEIAFRQSYRCNICDRFPIPPTFEVDHIHELQDGGLDRADNLSVFLFFLVHVVFCWSCVAVCTRGRCVHVGTWVRGCRHSHTYPFVISILYHFPHTTFAAKRFVRAATGKRRTRKS